MVDPATPYAARLQDAMRRAGRDPADTSSVRWLADHLKISYQAVKKAVTGDSKSLSAENNANAAKFLGVSSEWLATGEGVPQQRADLAGAEAHPPAGRHTFGGAQPGGGVAHNLSELQPILLPPTVDWETIAMGSIPERFILAMPDDALAPQTPRGTQLIFVAGSEPPRYGVGVLVEDASGKRFVRRWVQGPTGGWIAEARNTAYRSLASSEGARVIAWVQARFDGDV